MKKFICLGAALMLSACGGGDDTADDGDEIISGTVTGEDGKKADYSLKADDDSGSFSIKTKDGSFSINAGSGGKAKLPYGLTLPSDAKVVANVQMNQSGDGQNGSMLSFETSQSPDEIVGALKKQAEAKGFTVNSEVNASGTKMFTAERGEKEGISVTASPQDDKTTANVITGTKG